MEKLSNENIINLVDICRVEDQQTIGLLFVLCHFHIDEVVDQLNLGLPDNSFSLECRRCTITDSFIGTLKSAMFFVRNLDKLNLQTLDWQTN